MAKTIGALSKALATAGVFLALTVTDASAANQFRGNACIITATAACTANGWDVGGCGSARFTPPNWNGNPNRTGLSLYWGYYAQNYSGWFTGWGSVPARSGRRNGIFTYTGATARIAG